MSISATRKVTGSPRTDRNYTVSRGHGESFVENVDTSNNVFINEDVRNDDNRRQNPKQKFQDETTSEKSSSSSTSAAYVPNAIEAIAASNLYETSGENAYHSTKNVSVYDNNQSYVKDDNNDKLPQSYLKHFYENNQPPEEVDELV